MNTIDEQVEEGKWIENNRRPKFARIGNDICKLGDWFSYKGKVYWTLHPVSGKNPYVCHKEGEFYRYTPEENREIERTLQ